MSRVVKKEIQKEARNARKLYFWLKNAIFEQF